MTRNRSIARIPSIPHTPRTPRAAAAAAILALAAAAGLALSATLPAATASVETTGAAVVGQAAPGFQLKGIDGANYSLASYKGKVVVLEWINPNCPFSNRHAREHTMTELSKQHGEVVWLGINSTNPKSGDYLTPADHLAWNKKNGIVYPVLYDESGTVGHSYGARTTPHMFIVDAQGNVAYNGAIDDDPRASKPKTERTNYVGNGLSAEEAGKRPDPAATKPYGCSVKY
ncbi:MAG TPA: redoxin domain-containing protein [Thermoanaerobaculia bacterium]|nr:redoxin domain-containing protein [Thermoanaerobaculia bacterium]